MLLAYRRSFHTLHPFRALPEVLPVELDGKGSFDARGPVQAALTPAGKAHPITRLLPDPKANEEAWRKLPALTGINHVRGVRGETLLSAGSSAGSPPTPLLAVGRFGKGRTLALMTDDAWRWNFIAVGNKETPQHHLKLMRQAVRWLAQERSFQQVQIRPVAATQPGEKTEIKLHVLKDDFTPTREASVQLRVFSPEGEPIPVSAVAAREEGDYTAEYTPTREGTYRIEAEASVGGKVLGRDQNSFTAAYFYGEADDGLPRLELLQQLAEKNHGEYVPIAEWNEQALERIAARLESIAPSDIVEQRQTKLWNNLWPFSIMLLLLSAEWWMRRKWGLI